MEIKKRDFIIKYFGCHTTIDGNQVLTSLANSSRVPVDEFWNVFSSDAERYFEIWHIKGKFELSLILDDVTRKSIERKHIACFDIFN